jgi:hypothetical protein
MMQMTHAKLSSIADQVRRLAVVKKKTEGALFLKNRKRNRAPSVLGTEGALLSGELAMHGTSRRKFDNVAIGYIPVVL